MSEATNAAPVAAPAAAPKVKKVAKSAGTKPKSSNPTYLQMIVAAIKTLKEARGSSRAAILKYIVATYNLEPKAASQRANLTLRTAIKDGQLKHGKSTGTFKIGDKMIEADKDKVKKEKEKAKAAAVKAKEVRIIF